MSAEQIKQELAAKWADDAVLPVCIQIIDYVEHLPTNQRAMLTFRTLCNATDKPNVDGELVRALTILVSSRVAALTAWGLFVDEEDNEHTIDPDTLAEARSEGRFIHPITGEPVPEFEARVIPYFAASNRFEGASHER